MKSAREMCEELVPYYASFGMVPDFTTDKGYHDRVRQCRLMDLATDGQHGPLADFRRQQRADGYVPIPYKPRTPEEAAELERETNRRLRRARAR